MKCKDCGLISQAHIVYYKREYRIKLFKETNLAKKNYYKNGFCTKNIKAKWPRTKCKATITNHIPHVTEKGRLSTIQP